MKKISCFGLVVYVMVMVFVPVITGLLFFSKEEGLPKGYEKSKTDEISYFDISDGKVKTCDLEEYLVGVLAAEMPAEYELEALKAQAVAARSYILSKKDSKSDKHPTADICNDSTHCKGQIDEKTAKERWGKEKADTYWQKLTEATRETKGEYMICGDEVVEAFFFARSGGRTENSEDVWGERRPYLRSVESAGDLNYSQFISTAEFKNDEARRLLGILEKQSDKPLSIGKITRTDGGNIKSIEIDGKEYKGTEIRKIFDLKSADFDVTQTDKSVIFSVRGFGHGVGMSQFGANEMAEIGKKYTEILSHYYTNIQIVKK